MGLDDLMTCMIPQLVLLAADIGDLVTVVIAIFIALASFISFLKDKLQKAKAQDVGQPVAPRRDRSLQGEIDRFLQEVSGKSTERAQAEPIEIVEIEPSAARRDPDSQSAGSSRSSAAPPHRSPGSGIAERKLPGSTNLGSSVREHVSQHMQSGRVAHLVEEHLSHDVDKSVMQHLGTFGDRKLRQAKPRQDVSGGPGAIVNLLKSRHGIRQAVILSEILSRPKTRRR